MSRKSPLITLLTDFGTADYFVAAMKGVIFSANPFVRIVDITHEIPPQDIESGAFTLLTAYGCFPSNTIHVAVVDPGVGSRRRPIVVRAAEQFFVGPDNGLFSYIYDTEPAHKTVCVTAEKYFRHPVSPTFHGRDVFAPIAAALSSGTDQAAFGPEITDEVRLPVLRPLTVSRGEIEGRIIHIDRFGNCVTNIRKENLSGELTEKSRIIVKRKTIKTFRNFFAEDGPAEENLFAIWGSAGFLEIAAANRSAAELLKANKGTAILLHLGAVD